MTNHNEDRMNGAQEVAQDFGWCVLELMGHRRLGGRVREHTFAGAAFVRIDIPETEGCAATTQLYGPSAVYAITPTSEDIARAVAERNTPEPVSRWELRAIEAPKQNRISVPSLYTDDEDDDIADPDDLPFG